MSVGMGDKRATDLKIILKALAFAAHKHRDQRRKNCEASPYINHPIMLANILVNEGNVYDSAVICAALLHDTLEDTESTFGELTEQFGKTIAHIVLEVTLDMTQPMKVRKQEEIDRMEKVSPQARLVKLADKICNLRDVSASPPVGWSLQRRKEYFDHAQEVIEKLRGTHPELEGIFDTVLTLRPEH